MLVRQEAPGSTQGSSSAASDVYKRQAIDRLMAQGYDPIYGARPMKRLLQSKIETLIARKLVSGDIEPSTTLVVDVNQTDGFKIN